MILDILTYNIHGLPWSRDFTQGICEFLVKQLPSIICLQEVFHSVNRKYYYEFLSKIGYTVCIPYDEDVTLLPSGLLTAIKNEDFKVVNQCFCSFQHFHNVEWFANKGFHILTLLNKTTNKIVRIVNTHTQSDTFISYFFGRKVTREIRYKQGKQMYEYLKYDPCPVLIVGDLNCEHEPYEELKFLRPTSTHPLKKRTFYSTGEDLDHVVYLRNQTIPPPSILRCSIFDEPWSDHAPVRFTVDL